MRLVPYGRFKANATCSGCGKVSTVPNHPREVRDPFAVDSPLDSLNDWQRFRLGKNWERDNLGRRYQYGSWTRCDLTANIRGWHESGGGGLLISGSMGTGKTVATALMMTCLASRNEFSFAWWNMSALLSFLSAWNDWGDNNGQDETYKYLRECNYLFLDDLGVEYNVGRGMTRFNELIELRHSRELFHVGTSNLMEADLTAREGWRRVVDRLQQDVFDWCEIGGESKRRGAP